MRVLEKNAFKDKILSLDGNELVAVGYDNVNRQVLVRRVDLSEVPAPPVEVSLRYRMSIFKRALSRNLVLFSSNVSVGAPVSLQHDILFSSGGVVGIPYFQIMSDSFETVLKAYLIRPNEEATELWPNFKSAVHLAPLKTIAELENFPEAFDAAFDKLPICEYLLNSTGAVINVVLSDTAYAQLNPSLSYILRKQFVKPFLQNIHSKVREELDKIFLSFSESNSAKREELTFSITDSSMHDLPEVRSVLSAIDPIDIKNMFPDSNKLYLVKDALLSPRLRQRCLRGIRANARPKSL